MFISTNVAKICKILLIAVLWLANGCFMAVYGQNAVVDSLKRELERHKEEDTVRVKLLQDLAYEFMFNNPAIAEEYLNEAEAILPKVNSPKRMIGIYGAKGNLYQIIANNTKSYEYLDKAMEIAKKYNFKKDLLKVMLTKAGVMARTQNSLEAKIMLLSLWKMAKQEKYEKEEPTIIGHLGGIYLNEGKYDSVKILTLEGIKVAQKTNNLRGEAGLLNNMSTALKRQGHYAEAVDYLLQAIKIYQKIGDKINESAMYLNAGIIYSSLESFDNAITYVETALKIKIEIKDKEIGLVYQELGNIFFGKKDINKSNKYFNQALDAYQVIGDSIGIGDIKYCLGQNYIYIEKYKEAVILLEEGCLINKKHNGNIQTYVISLGLLADTYRKLKDYNKSVIYSREAINLSKQYNFREQLKKQYQFLSVVYLEKSSLPKAVQDSIFTYINSVNNLTDSIAKNKYKGEVAEKLVKYETEKKDLENAKLKAENELKDKANRQQQYLFGAGLLVLVLGAIFFFYRNRQKATQALQAKELAMIQEKLAEIENVFGYFSTELHDGVKSRLKLIASQISAEEGQELQAIIDEISIIADKAAEQPQLPLPERIQWFMHRNIASKLSYKVEFTPTVNWQQLDRNTALHLWRMVTELTLNAVKANATFISLNLQMENNQLLLTLTDDGDGMLPEQLKNGTGLQNIQERAKNLGGTMQLFSQPNEGTNVVIKVPLVYA